MMLWLHEMMRMDNMQLLVTAHHVYLQGVQSLVNTLIGSLPALWNVGTLLCLFLFMYSYMGMLYFGKIAFAPE